VRNTNARGLRSDSNESGTIYSGTKETAGARAAIRGDRPKFMEFGWQIAGGASRTAGLGACFWLTSRGEEVWIRD
jgi:hypothetical protein